MLLAPGTYGRLRRRTLYRDLGKETEETKASVMPNGVLIEACTSSDWKGGREVGGGAGWTASSSGRGALTGHQGGERL